MRVHTIGSIAHQQLQQAKHARVVGQSSRGIYLRLDTSWVIFLAWEGPPGPLTALLDSELSLDLTAGSSLEVTRGFLQFPASTGRLDFRIAEIWQAPPAQLGPEGAAGAAVRAARLAEMARLAGATRPNAGWSALLPGVEPRLEALAGRPPVVRPALDTLRTALASSNVAAASGAMGQLIGLGSGLTPSGDDLALGLLLAVSRWGAVLLPALDRAGFAARVVKRARQATSDLSASLIESAALGQADPRLIAAVDSLVVGQPALEACAAGLAEWGHSSGLDALLGMSLTI